MKKSSLPWGYKNILLKIYCFCLFSIFKSLINLELLSVCMVQSRDPVFFFWFCKCITPCHLLKTHYHLLKNQILSSCLYCYKVKFSYMCGSVAIVFHWSINLSLQQYYSISLIWLSIKSWHLTGQSPQSCISFVASYYYQILLSCKF